MSDTRVPGATAQTVRVLTLLDALAAAGLVPSSSRAICTLNGFAVRSSVSPVEMSRTNE